MPHFYEHINILVMPTDACNMNCVYCFHKPHQNGIEVMGAETLKRMLDITVPFYKSINFIWHGGEPLLVGLDFYQKVVELQKQSSCDIKNSIQSNLTLMTPEFATFFAENNFNISGSYDGICNKELRGNDEKILAGRMLITETGRRCGLIMVVSNYNIDHLIDSYLFFKNLKVNFSLNLYLDQRDNKKSELQLEEDTTINRLNELFDYWAYDITGTIHISYFKHILEFILFKRKSLCTYTSCLGRWIGIRHDGEIVPCNRYFPSEYGYGNVFDYTDIGEAFDSNGFKTLLKQAIIRREKCKSCEIYLFCNGGCNNNAINESGIENNSGLSCNILKGVYKHIDEFVKCTNSTEADCGKYNPLYLKLLNESQV